MSQPEASIDFEWRSGSDIGLGLPAYFRDPESAPLCLVYDLNDGMGRYRWVPGDDPPLRLWRHVQAGGLVRGWNVMFEWCCWNWWLVPQFGWPELPLEQCVCTMAEAQAMNLPAALDKCGAVLGLAPEKQKSARGKQLIQLLCVPHPEPEVLPLEKYRTKGAHTRAVNDRKRWEEQGGRWINDPGLLQELYAYCDQDVVAEQAIKRQVRRLTPYERQVWITTQRINLRGVPIARDEIRAVHHVVKVEQRQLDAELAVITGGEVQAGSEVSRLRDWCNARLPADDQLSDMTAETVDQFLLRHQAESLTTAPLSVLRALRIRSQVGQTSTAKLPKILQVAADDDTLKFMHVYHGASTGRDASRGGVNLQNLKSPIIKDIGTAIALLSTGDHELARLVFGDALMDAAVSVVRGMIKAPPGMEFTDADFSSVENRVSAWIAGQKDKLELFEKGLDEYRTIAVQVFGVPYEEVTGAQRKFCKPIILGGMFGQGALGLVDYAAGMGVHMRMDQAIEMTNLYRAQYRKVRNLWYRCGDAAVEAVSQPDTWIKAGEKLRLVCWRNFLWMELPSGRRIAWAAPKIENRETPWGEVRPAVTVEQMTITHQWRREVLIGSSIFQSAVQATARDLLMNGVNNVEAAGYRVVLRVHDELLSCNPIGFGSPDEFGALMCKRPEWASDLPLAFEAWRADRFRK